LIAVRHFIQRFHTADDKNYTSRARGREGQQMVILYSPEGRMFPLERGLWQAALREAETMGWRPAGTCGPPRSLGARSGEPWQGEYGEACGQEVTRDDAQEFGWALARSGRAEFSLLCAFSLGSGFLVCEPAAQWQPRAAPRELERQPEEAGGYGSAQWEPVSKSG
jgi:hypothetical protein